MHYYRLVCFIRWESGGWTQLNLTFLFGKTNAAYMTIGLWHQAASWKMSPWPSKVEFTSFKWSEYVITSQFYCQFNMSKLRQTHIPDYIGWRMLLRYASLRLTRYSYVGSGWKWQHLITTLMPLLFFCNRQNQLWTCGGHRHHQLCSRICEHLFFFLSSSHVFKCLIVMTCLLSSWIFAECSSSLTVIS